jgi:hypothetical protein
MRPEEHVTDAALKDAAKATKKNGSSQNSNLRASRTIEKANQREQDVNLVHDEAEAELLEEAATATESAEPPAQPPAAPTRPSTPSPGRGAGRGGSR